MKKGERPPLGLLTGVEPRIRDASPGDQCIARGFLLALGRRSMVCPHHQWNR